MEDLLFQLDELGVAYTEDIEAGTVTIDISTVEKDVLVDIIIMLNDGMYAFNITADTIVVETGAATEETDTTETEDYLNDALTAM